MQVTPLELGIAAAALAVAFGPKRLPSFKRQVKDNSVDLSLLAPSQPAAARAPSPLATSSAPPPAAQVQQPVPQPPRQQYAMSGAPAPLRLPNEF